MEREDGGARVGEWLNKPLRLDDHEVHVERQRGAPAHRLDDLRAEREIRHELAIHDVDVNPVGAAGLAHRDLVAQASEVGAQN